MNVSFNGDPIGKALSKKLNGENNLKIIVHSDDFDDDDISVNYLFRDFDEMPEIEKKALQLCRGKILDAGACAGSHSLWLQGENKDVHAIEISKGAVKVMRQRGVRNIISQDINTLQGKKFDTILMLMNGIGIVEDIRGLINFLNHAKTLLNRNGQILLDSSDIVYLFDEVPPVDLKNYYGEIYYRMEFEGEQSNRFCWLYIDALTLQNIAEANGFDFELILTGSHYEYLARLSLRTCS